ncbi:MAG TPA: tetratricopeptide repeat protein [Pyrinomonadaceae bacterium]|nr:tetratricopeptide repeat protein [Pyrinomonadaceae bacterium]
MNFLRCKKFTSAVVFLLVFAVCLNAQTAAEMRESVKFEQQAAADYKAQDYAKFLENIRKASDLRPNHARILYNLADAYALNGKTDEALAVLERLAAMDLFFAVEKDDDFKSLFGSQRFKAIQNEFALNQKASNRSAKAFSIPEKDLLTEGIAYDAAAKRFFVSSIYKRKIVAVDANGKVSDFSRSSDGLWSVSGMRVDAARRVLWVTTTALAQVPGLQKADEGKSGVFKYDLRSGKLLKKYILSNTDGKHVLGDLIIAKNGDVFASDSLAPNIYRIATGKDELEIFLTSDNFASLQGLAFSPDEKYLFAADYSKGVHKIEMAGKRLTQIAMDANTNPIGIDGLYFHQGNLIVIQNGFRPFRVARFFLNNEQSAVTKSETLEANHADIEEPTLGVIVGSDFYFLANSQQSLIGKDGKLAEGKLKEPVILRLKL